MEVPVPANWTEAQGLSAVQYVFGFRSVKVGIAVCDVTVTGTPLRWKVTVSVFSWPKVASNGWRRLPGSGRRGR